MYSREYFLGRFREQESDELLDRLSGGELTDEAGQAIGMVLRERGLSGEELERRVREAKKARYRSSSPTKECDFCGKRTGFSGVKDEGQKFCNRQCLRTARLMEVAVDIPQEEILMRAVAIKNGACPSCGGRESDIEVRSAYWVWSALVLTRWGTSPRVCCRKCGLESNLKSIASSLFLGWWGVPWGLFITPAQIFSNIAAIARRTDASKPSEELVQAAMLQLAEAQHAPPAAPSRGLGTAQQ